MCLLIPLHVSLPPRARPRQKIGTLAVSVPTIPGCLVLPGRQPTVVLTPLPILTKVRLAPALKLKFRWTTFVLLCALSLTLPSPVIRTSRRCRGPIIAPLNLCVEAPRVDIRIATLGTVTLGSKDIGKAKQAISLITKYVANVTSMVTGCRTKNPTNP